VRQAAADSKVAAPVRQVLRRQVARRKGSTRLTGPCWQLLPATCRPPRGMFSWSRQRTLLRWHQAIVPPNWPQPRRPGRSAAVADGRTGVGAAACTAEPALGHRRICGELAKLGFSASPRIAARSLLAAWGRRRLAPARGSCPYISRRCEAIPAGSGSSRRATADPYAATTRTDCHDLQARLVCALALPREPGVESPHPSRIGVAHPTLTRRVSSQAASSCPGSPT
jgi:hypothetical protein